MRAHKLFLSSVSLVFKKMFFGKFKDEEEVKPVLLINVLRLRLFTSPPAVKSSHALFCMLNLPNIYPDDLKVVFRVPDIWYGW